jgi:allophanate hydrolase subunit 1
VLFGVDAPDLGGFANLVAASSASVWKFGQMRPGDKIRFVVVDVATSLQLKASSDAWLAAVEGGNTSSFVPGSLSPLQANPPPDSKVAEQGDFIIRASSDEYINVEIGPMVLDMQTRVRAQLFEREMVQRNVAGIKYIDTSIRSSIMHYDPAVISQDELIKVVLEAISVLGDVGSVTLPINVYRLPIVPDDRWTHESIEYYRKTARKEAVYLPNNFKYVAKNNGLEEEQMRDVLLGTPWTVVAIGFFVMLPLLIVSACRS